ncbi:hypothetical protein DK847_09215 [Aestuariivirga litoralis]|uniref:DUF1501 domain-containing protein n=1 Tax=Aestuariivirga litoralis TaxID=2650924 RepID=A0A2W2AQ04_9HYPH|nr:DUF1501 domain-containing protein [Aestuariivirga litoralis]PZF77485.1 hypothetical protein DK847_09215 [Aestuariivirga litoralis]
MQDHDHGHDIIDPRIEAAAAEGCSESRLYLNRRALLGATASLSAWAFMPRSSSATGNNDREKRLLVVLLQGGLDGLHLVAPLGDPDYGVWRNGLRQSATDMADLDGFFYLNKAMTNFHAWYEAGDAAIVHAIAPPLRVRSHFHCMYNLEAGTNGQAGARTARNGWMNRLLAYLPQGDAIAGVTPEIRLPRGLALGGAPFILKGERPVLTWTPDRWPWYSGDVQTLYNASNGGDMELATYLALGDGVRTVARSNPSAATGSVNSTFYGAGKLMGAATGPRVAAIQIVGFDAHRSEKSGMAYMLNYLDTCLKSFRDGLGEGAEGEAAWRNTVVACVSEFGRTVWDNGQDGTDHGTGTAALLVGGAVAGRKVTTDWPWLKDLQDKRDLKAPYCTRMLFKGILKDHLGISEDELERGTDGREAVFPDSADAKALTGLIKSQG